jgi:hypothetical protein
MDVNQINAILGLGLAGISLYREARDAYLKDHPEEVLLTDEQLFDLLKGDSVTLKSRIDQLLEKYRS